MAKVSIKIVFRASVYAQGNDPLRNSVDLLYNVQKITIR